MFNMFAFGFCLGTGLESVMIGLYWVALIQLGCALINLPFILYMGIS